MTLRLATRVRPLAALALLLAGAPCAAASAAGTVDDTLRASERGRRATREPSVDMTDIPVVTFVPVAPRPGETFSGVRTDPFAYWPPKAGSAGTPGRQPPVPSPEALPPTPAAASQPPAIPRPFSGPPQPPDFTYEYVGVIGPEQGRYAILQDASKAFTFAKAGDVIDKQFKVERVGRLNLDLSFTDEKFDGQHAQVPRQLAAPKAPGASTAPASAPKPSAPSSRPRK